MCIRDRFWSTHIIFTGMIVTRYNLPLTIGALQTLIVALLSFIVGSIYEEFILNDILKEIDSILYAGILSGGFAFVLQIYAQRQITPAPAAIIFSDFESNIFINEIRGLDEGKYNFSDIEICRVKPDDNDLMRVSNYGK